MAALQDRSQDFTPSEAAAVYRAIRERRDMRHFVGGAVAPEVLQRLLQAAHHAPSVGFMQPWRFIRIADRTLRRELHQAVETERILTARALGQREDEFMRLKVEGLLEAAEVLAVALADQREAHVFGRRTMPQMDLASAACAIQNLWLAARAEGLGLGWVSLFDPAQVGRLLQLPAGAAPIALLCLGPVREFYAEPMLQRERWASRLALSDLVFEDRWGQPPAREAGLARSPPTSQLPTEVPMTLPDVPALADPQLRARVQHALDNKTKPLGSLGAIEALAARLAMILGTLQPQLQAPQLVVCAADHGLAARGVSAYPSDVTWQMVENFLAGGAAVSVLARQHGLQLTVVDCGVRHDWEARPGLRTLKTRHGTADSLVAAAMTAAQCDEALANGVALVRELPGNVLLLGEMGIGNTSAASMLLARLAGFDIAACTGAGTGLDDDGVARKTEVLRQVLARHADSQAPLAALAAFGGLEIATLAGMVLEAAAQRRVIVVDGFITGAAVLVAHKLRPAVLERCVFAHRSGERGHRLLLDHLGAEPLLDLGLRLGEGSGAALAWPLLVSATALLREMASFESAGVSRQDAR